MKAKAYFEKYDPMVNNTELDYTKVMKDLIADFATECKEMAEKRKIKTPKALVGVVEEINDKWNALENLFIKNYGVSPIKHNGFRDAYSEIDGTYNSIKTLVESQASDERFIMRIMAKKMNARNG